MSARRFHMMQPYCERPMTTIMRRWRARAASGACTRGLALLLATLGMLMGTVTPTAAQSLTRGPVTTETHHTDLAGNIRLTTDEYGAVVACSLLGSECRWKGAIRWNHERSGQARRGAPSEQGHQKLDKLMTGLSRADARSVEQALIEIHGLEKNGGTLIINSIASTNPAYASAVQRGDELFRSIGY
jgi:hypothetical protein